MRGAASCINGKTEAVWDKENCPLSLSAQRLPTKGLLEAYASTRLYGASEEILSECLLVNHNLLQ